ncbi:hypothetical protein GA830_03365 [Mesorhizobium sp. NBSH29]|uniref:hypothetical protein n=1 Tax=Mesorhizobium sp. NBSH29 TaxID=2654249 RepID=UPI0018968982|nr:hypothetical protein [Mesorhizobium sp. NBSH29]QPC85878.1 hypothetical protein GA830_03365 [Mesorhizobium sp. NBSH29]
MTSRHSKDVDDQNTVQARRILDRVASEAEAGGSSRLRGGDGEDWAEVWGTRIGKILGPLIVVAIVGWFLFFLLRG